MVGKASLLYFGCLSKGQLSPRTTSGQEAFIDRRRELHAETGVSSDSHLETGHQWSTSTVLVVLGTVNLQVQALLISVSLRPILKIVAAYVMATA